MQKLSFIQQLYRSTSALLIVSGAVSLVMAEDNPLTTKAPTETTPADTTNPSSTETSSSTPSSPNSEVDVYSLIDEPKPATTPQPTSAIPEPVIVNDPLPVINQAPTQPAPQCLTEADIKQIVDKAVRESCAKSLHNQQTTKTSRKKSTKKSTPSWVNPYYYNPYGYDNKDYGYRDYDSRGLGYRSRYNDNHYGFNPYTYTPDTRVKYHSAYANYGYDSYNNEVLYAPSYPSHQSTYNRKQKTQEIVKVPTKPATQPITFVEKDTRLIKAFSPFIGLDVGFNYFFPSLTNYDLKPSVLGNSVLEKKIINENLLSIAPKIGLMLNYKRFVFSGDIAYVLFFNRTDPMQYIPANSYTTAVYSEILDYFDVNLKAGWLIASNAWIYGKIKFGFSSDRYETLVATRTDVYDTLVLGQIEQTHFGFGLGGEYLLNQHMAIHADYTISFSDINLVAKDISVVELDSNRKPIAGAKQSLSIDNNYHHALRIGVKYIF